MFVVLELLDKILDLVLACCLSPGSVHCNGTIAAVSCGCGDAATGFPSASARSFGLFLHSALT